MIVLSLLSKGAFELTRLGCVKIFRLVIDAIHGFDSPRSLLYVEAMILPYPFRVTAPASFGSDEPSLHMAVAVADADDDAVTLASEEEVVVREDISCCSHIRHCC